MKKKDILSKIESVLDSKEGDLSPENREKLEGLKEKVETGITVEELLKLLIELAKFFSGFDDWFTNL
ncbi:MAG TPA: hypothetical protein PK649_05240 [Vicingus sp.]|nr:hypothetical protein [Vicingus sp.]HRP58952.1 hypothetical protein [Vicingus sp.]